jgi:mannose-6-phosphate isomerase-like protein (cupin superfamily)
VSAPRLPGSIGMSRLSVYDWPTDDDLTGGSPHVHTVSAEAYSVVSGRGEVHTLSSGGFEVFPLEAGDSLSFTPGTIHRLVNHGRLEILTIMQNTGLPEAGDAVLTFPLDVLRDAGRYQEAVTLSGSTEDERANAARKRRDLAVLGYTTLRASVEEHGTAVLREFYDLAAALVQSKTEHWTQLWQATVEAETERTRSQLAAIGRGDTSHLAEATVAKAVPRSELAFGMCGRLHIWDAPPAT